MLSRSTAAAAGDAGRVGQAGSAAHTLIARDTQHPPDTNCWMTHTGRRAPRGLPRESDLRIRGRDEAALEFDTASLQDEAAPRIPSSVRRRHPLAVAAARDAMPAPDALYQLLAHVTIDPSIDLTGPRLLLPRRRHAASRSARLVSASPVRAAVSSSWMQTRSTKVSVTSLRNVLAFPLRHAGAHGPGHQLGGLTQRCRFSGTALSSAGGLTERPQRGHHAKCPVTHRQVGRAGLRPHGSLVDGREG